MIIIEIILNNSYSNCKDQEVAFTIKIDDELNEIENAILFVGQSITFTVYKINSVTQTKRSKEKLICPASPWRRLERVGEGQRPENAEINPLS